MGGRLAGKTALITAAGQGIGHATAVAFQKEGAQLWATDIDESKLAGLATLEGVTCRALDVRDEGAVAAAAEEIGAVHVLFNCAGRVPHGTLLDCEPADWEETLEPQRDCHVPDDPRPSCRRCWRWMAVRSSTWRRWSPR